MEATKPWLEAGELMHGDHDPCLPRARRLREVMGRGGSGSLIVLSDIDSVKRVKWLG